MREKAIKIKRKRCASDWFLDIFKVVFLVLVTVICVYPFWNIFVVSINDATDAPVSYTHLTLPTTSRV